MTQDFETIKDKIDRLDYMRRNNFCMATPLHKQSLKSEKKKRQTRGKNLNDKERVKSSNI